MLRLCLLALALILAPTDARVMLEVRVFAGAHEVTQETRITVHQAADRQSPVAQVTRPSGKVEIPVAPGIYDVQAIRERDGRVVAIRWVERLAVMAYPDEDGHHLEVINLVSGFGALQARSRAAPAAVPDVAVYEAGTRTKPVAAPVPGDGYALFVLPAGRYDLRVLQGTRLTWRTGLEAPLDRTRLVIVP